jgi:FkbM family methyltransferase
MLNFSSLLKKYSMAINGIVHIGAHKGQEIAEYRLNGIEKIVCFDPLEENCNFIKQNYTNIDVFQCALGNEEMTAQINVSNNDGLSSSILDPLLHLSYAPSVLFNEKRNIEIKKLNSFSSDILKCNYLCIDVQGYEYEVLQGSDSVIDQFDYIFCEVNKEETYKNNKLISEIDELLATYGFTRCETHWWSSGEPWGDALYVKNEYKDIGNLDIC